MVNEGVAPAGRLSSDRVCRSASPTAIAQAIATLSERRPGRIGIVEPRIGGGMHLRPARRPNSRPNSSTSSAREAVVEIEVVAPRVVNRISSSPALAPPVLERRPRGMPRQRHLVEIVHAGAAEGAVGDREAGRLDDMGRDAEAGAEPQNRAGILRDVGLVKGEVHGASGSGSGSCPVRRRNCVSAKRFSRSCADAAKAGLPLPGKGANRTAPDAPLTAFPRRMRRGPFAATGGRFAGAIRSLAVCSARGLTGTGERALTVTPCLRPSRRAAISFTSRPARSARSAPPRSPGR